MTNDQRNEPKYLSLVIGLIVSCGAAVSFFGVFNYSLNESFWSFSILQTIGMLILFSTGGLIAYSIHNKELKRVIFFINAYTIIVGIYTVLYGFEVIHKEEVVIRFVQFRGGAAIYYGKMSVGLGVFLIISSLFTKIKTDAPKSPDFVICRNCLEPLSARSIADSTCQKCGEIMEDLKGFYDRHPELKEAKE
jgi:hypothetical protein